MRIETACVRAGYEPGTGEPRQLPIVQSTTFKYPDSDSMGRLFDLEDQGYFYSRLSNPTVDGAAAKLCALEGGAGALLTSSGQSASFFACINICEAGGHIVSASNIYGGTYNLFAVTLKKLGIDVTFIDGNASDEELEAAFRPETRLVFGETLSNPGVRVLDIERFARAAHAHGVPLIVDNTFPTPMGCRPFDWGADIVIHSTTKYLDGHGVSLGGAVVDGGRFDWMAHAELFPGLCTPDQSYHGMVYAERFGNLAYLAKMQAHLIRDIGAIQSPQNAFYLNLGMQTLHLRIKRHRESALQVARFLESRPEVKWIRYPDLESDPDHALQQKYLPSGSCGVMAFAIEGGRPVANRFMDALHFVTIETHVADCYSCILHPASHTHRQLSDQQLLEAGVEPDLMRLSIGLEDPADLIEDIAAALDSSK